LGTRKNERRAHDDYEAALNAAVDGDSNVDVRLQT